MRTSLGILLRQDALPLRPRHDRSRGTAAPLKCSLQFYPQHGDDDGVGEEGYERDADEVEP